jgi:aldehyde dehydrogenase (NAD+)
VREALKFYIGGRWVEPVEGRTIEVVNPADERVIGHVALGGPADVDAAVKAARAAFPQWSATSREARIEIMQRIVAGLKERHAELGRVITEEMGANAEFAHQVHAGVGMVHMKTAMRVLRDYEFEKDRGGTRIVQEPIGVCAFITPWNYPINQIAVKVAPALATGCTMVLKPSEMSPFSAGIWAEVLDAAGVPPGVFNLVNGDGPTVGRALSGHADVDMVSFTGSTQAGIDVAQNAALTVKRVAQELGGKSPNIILDHAGFAKAVEAGVQSVMTNCGQSCNAPTRMLVPRARMDEAAGVAKACVEAMTVGDPRECQLGPVVSQGQWSKIQDLIRSGIEEGARLVTGGTGRPEHLEKGFYVKPTVFAYVGNDMTVAREEIFGPVLSIIPYDDVEQAIALANDTEYGIAAYVSGDDPVLLNRVAGRLRAAQVMVNRPPPDPMAPFGGYKKSGNGREWGDYGFHEFLEVKALIGCPAAA